MKIKPERAPASGKFPFRERIRAFWGAFPMVLLFLLVIGGMFLGWFTANQSAAIGAMGAFLYMVIKNRANIRVNYKATVEALWETAKTVGMIFLILIGAYCLGYFMSISTIPTSLAKWIGGLPVNRWVILVAILVFYAFLGCLMDAFAMVLLTTPIFLRSSSPIGFDPVWYGVLMVMVMEMGLITPPVGMNLYIMKGCVGDSISMATIIKGAAPHILGLVAAVTVTLLFPQIALWLPSLFYS